MSKGHGRRVPPANELKKLSLDGEAYVCSGTARDDLLLRAADHGDVIGLDWPGMLRPPHRLDVEVDERGQPFFAAISAR